MSKITGQSSGQPCHSEFSSCHSDPERFRDEEFLTKKNSIDVSPDKGRGRTSVARTEEGFVGKKSIIFALFLLTLFLLPTFTTAGRLRETREDEKNAPCDQTTKSTIRQIDGGIWQTCDGNGVWKNRFCRSCEMNDRTINCVGLPIHAERNTATSLTQSWDRNKLTRLPSIFGKYNETVSTSECRFKCASGYHRSNNRCVSSTRQADCIGLPDNAQRNTATGIIQNWNGTDWLPSATGSYNATASASECRYKCATGYERKNNNCEELPQVPTVTYNGYVIMDRNLGASRVCTSLTDTECYGDVYQRGNNNGFPSTSKGTASDAGITTSATQVAATAGYSSSTWITTNPWMNNGSANRNAAGDTLWGGKLDTTTANGAGTTSAGRQGPCPTGFHVPSTLERKNMLNGANPYSLFSTLKLPLAGYRNTFNAATADVGSYGYYWSSSPGNGAGVAYYPYFNSSYVSPQNGINRSQGFSVRCFQNS